MKTYAPENIRNVALIGHSDSGKTTLAEALMYSVGELDRFGKVPEGNTVSDYDPEEIKRKTSINMAVAPFTYNNTKINLLDAPGLFDFEAGAVEAVTACDTALIVVSGRSGVTVGAKKAYKLATKQGKSKAFFVSKLDSENADFYKVLTELKTVFGPSVCPIVVPFAEDKVVTCYINLIEMKAYAYKDGKATEVAMPDTQHRLDGLIAAISEAVAETDEALFEKYFSDEPLTREEIMGGIKKGIKDGSITPVYCGAPLNLDAIDMLKDAMVELFPSAADTETMVSDAAGGVLYLSAMEMGPTVSYVFKTLADPFVGKLSFVKVISGKLTSNLSVINATTGEEEKLGKLLCMKGKKQDEVKELVAGDIGAISKLGANTGDTLYAGMPYTVEAASYPQPCYSMAVELDGKGDESKLAQAIGRLIEEDPTLSFTQNAETHQQVISGLGEQHLDVVLAKLKNKFSVTAALVAPKVAYRETIRKSVKVQGKHKKQSGGHGQYGDVWIEFSPCESAEMVFEQSVVGGTVPKNFYPAVEKGLRECVVKGVLAGYPVVGLKANLYDGSYHPVDSSEAAFKMAAALAYKNGLPQASPALLEPIGKLEVTVPDDKTGDMMGELNKRRGRVLGMNPDEDKCTVIEAEVPMSEMHDFATLVRQMTQGAGSFVFEFERYETLPSNLEAEVIAAAKE